METILQEHIDRVTTANDNTLLGKLLWYTVSEVCISHVDIVKGLTAVGLQAHAPRYPLDYDVFRRVSSRAELRRVPTATTGITQDYLIREVTTSGADVAVRRIVCETRNQAGKKLDYVQLRDIEFDKKSGKISFTDLVTDTNPHVQAITADITSQYVSWKGKLNSYGVREFIRKFVLNMGGTLVREGGGVYFLMESKADQLDALETFVNGLSSATAFHSLPLVDDLKQRTMIRKAFEADTVDSIDRMIMEVTDLKREGKKISTKQYARIVTDFQKLTKNTQEYEKLLEVTMGNTEGRLNLFRAAVMNLQDLVKQ